MPSFAGVAGDFLQSWVSLSGGAAGTPVSFAQNVTGLIAGTGSANGTGAMRNTSAGGSENPNFNIPSGVARITMVAGQWRAVAAPVAAGVPSAWYNYLQSQGAI